MIKDDDKLNTAEKNINSKSNLSDQLESLNNKIKSFVKQINNQKNKDKKKYINNQIDSLNNKKNSIKNQIAKSSSEDYDINKKINHHKKPKKIKVVAMQMNKVEFKSSLVKMMKPYSTKKKIIKYPLIVLLGFIASMSTLFLIQNTGLYSMGLSGILQGIARLSRDSISGDNEELGRIIYNILFWSLYFLINIPLIIFAYYKVSKKFASLTLVYVFCSQIFGLVFSFIPGVDQIFLFGNPSIGTNQNIISWNSQTSLFPLFFYACLQGVIIGGCFSFLYMLGSSTGGTDIVSFYYSKIKNKSISLMMMYINSSCLLLSSIIGTIIPLLISSKHNDIFIDASHTLQAIFSPNLLFSFIVAIIVSILISLIFPKNKLIKINVYSEQVMEIKEKIIQCGYPHAITINNTIGGYSWTAKQNIETICFYFELPEFVANIREVDKEALIVTHKIADIDGKFMVVSS